MYKFLSANDLEYHSSFHHHGVQGKRLTTLSIETALEPAYIQVPAASTIERSKKKEASELSLLLD